MVLACGNPKGHEGNHKGSVECVIDGISDVREFEWVAVAEPEPEVIEEPPRAVESPVSSVEELPPAEKEIPVEQAEDDIPENLQKKIREKLILEQAELAMPEQPSESIDDEFDAVQKALYGKETSDE